MHAAQKKLNEMNRLADMAHFPALVNAGATANILLTVSITWWLQPQYPSAVAPFAWIVIVLCVNLLPVVLLRLSLDPASVYPSLREMNFVRDQHKFSDWVYLAASANMSFWLFLTWVASSLLHTGLILLGLLVAAFLITFSPVLLRGLKGKQFRLRGLPKRQ